MRALNSSSSAGRHLRLDGFCQRQAASPPSGLLPLAVTCAWVVSVSGRLLLRPRASRPSPSHRCAAGPSLYKRGCLRLRSSPAASSPVGEGIKKRSPGLCRAPFGSVDIVLLLLVGLAVAVVGAGTALRASLRTAAEAAGVEAAVTGVETAALRALGAALGSLSHIF